MPSRRQLAASRFARSDRWIYRMVRGKIDDFAIFGDPLTPAQISQLASGASPLSLFPSGIDFTQFKLNSYAAQQPGDTRHGLPEPGNPMLFEVSQIWPRDHG